MYNSVKDGKIETLPSVSTIADGIAVKSPGKITFEMCKKYVDGIVTVSDDEVSAAILALMESRKLVAEGAGAVSLAAAMFRKVPSLEGKKVCCVISGGNIDVNVLSRVISRGLLMSGRICTLTVEVPDRPGQLGEVASLIAKCGGNVTSVHHERTSEASAVNGCLVRISMETRNFGHIDEIKRTLVQNGLKLVREIQ